MCGMQEKVPSRSWVGGEARGLSELWRRHKDRRVAGLVPKPGAGVLTGGPTAVARDILKHGMSVVRAYRWEWEAMLVDGTNWTPFEGNRRIV